MTKPSLTLLFSLALLLAACGGGGGGGGGYNPPPAPSPTPTPTPTLTPTPVPSGVATPAVAIGPGTPLSGSATYKGGWTPYAVAADLDFPVQHGWDGTGQTVAIVIDSDVNRSIITTYLAGVGVNETGTIKTISVDGSTGVATNGDQTEAYLDVETVAGLAPGADIRIYQIKDLTDASIAKAYSLLNSDGVAKIANSSFGGCEVANSPEDPFIQSGAQAGIVYVASAGDTGNVCDGAKQVGASWPASNPNAIGAGGTETRISTGYPLTSATVWNDTSCTGTPSQCAGGGGVSTLYPLPAYQTGLAGESSTSLRNTPDISMPAEDTVIDDGSWGLINGTSWASPEYAALMAQVYQYCHVSAGIANPVNVPYYVASVYGSAYIDVTKGNDQFQGTTPFYTAAPGYDDASGLGVPLGTAFANTACPGGTKAPGLLARSAMSSLTMQQSMTSTTLDVTPPTGGLVDQGPRPAGATTKVQLVLHSDAEKAAVEAALQAAGFTIDHAFSYHRIVDAQAPSATVERFFRTRMRNVLQGRFGVRYLPATQIAVPQSIASHVAALTLDNVITRHVLVSRLQRLP